MQTILTIIGFIITILCVLITRPERKFKYNFNFEDTINKYNLPIISLEHQGKTYNFIIDTGANQSMINASALNEFKYENINKDTTVSGLESKRKTCKQIYVEFEKDNHKFSDVFLTLPISNLDKMNKEHNSNIVGLLGNSFLRRYNFILNYIESEMSSNG